jgi:hypothetical protein
VRNGVDNRLRVSQRVLEHLLVKHDRAFEPRRREPENKRALREPVPGDPGIVKKKVSVGRNVRNSYSANSALLMYL